MELSDGNAEEYLVFVNEHELTEPELDKELPFLATHGADSDKFADTYCAFAANLAKDWYDRHGWHDISLDEFIRTANIGLMYSRQLFIDYGITSTSFKNYAKHFIESRLDELVQTRKE